MPIDESDLHPKIPVPRILGRFNYSQTIKDHYIVLYLPYQGAACQIIARNLPYKIASDLCDELNSVLRDFGEEIRDTSEGAD